MKENSLGSEGQILIKIPDAICKLYNLKPNMEFEVMATVRPTSKLLISFLCSIESK